MFLFRVLAFLWPFLKEMILGDKTLKEALKTNKGRVFLCGLILLSVALNFLAIPKLFHISADYVSLNRKYIELRRDAGKVEEEISGGTHDGSKTTAPEVKPQPVAIPTNQAPIPPPKPLRTVTPLPYNDKERQRRIKESFDRIRALEAKQTH